MLLITTVKLSFLFITYFCRPKDVLNWLNDLEYITNKDPSKGPISQTKSDKIKEGEEWQNNEYVNLVVEFPDP